MKLFYHLGRYFLLMARVFSKPEKFSIYFRQIIFEINETELITDKADKPASNEQQKSDDDLITSFDELKEFTRPKEKTLYEHLKTLHNYAKKLHDFLKKFF